MKKGSKAVAALLGFSSLLLTLPAKADAPALYWWRETVNYSIAGCYNQAEQIMREQGLQDIEVGKEDVYGHTDNAAVAVSCFKNGRETVALIIVTGSDNTEVKNLRETIKNGF